jgi:hypothetical protein
MDCEENEESTRKLRARKKSERRKKRMRKRRKKVEIRRPFVC